LIKNKEYFGVQDGLGRVARSRDDGPSLTPHFPASGFGRGIQCWSTKKLSPKERSKVLWHLNKVPLIVKAKGYHQEQVKHALRLLEKVEKKKVVLLANATKEEFPGWRIFQDLSDLPNEGVYTDIIKHFAVSHQGQPPMFLDQLLNFDKGNDRTIETTELIKMTQEVVQIGKR
jgi:hypothetical protein